MPSADPTANAPSLQRDGARLRIAGDLIRATVPGLWRPALAALPGVRALDLSGLGRVDSSGVALVAELATRAGGVTVSGEPAPLAALRAAYRLDPAFEYLR